MLVTLKTFGNLLQHIETCCHCHGMALCYFGLLVLLVFLLALGIRATILNMRQVSYLTGATPTSIASWGFVATFPQLKMEMS